MPSVTLPIGFLRNKKDKTKDKKGWGKKDSEDDESNNGSMSGSKMDLHETLANGKNSEYIIDAEGFTVRPVPAQKEGNNFYSSSDSDSDSEDEKEKKIYVKINPLKNGNQISASVDQLIASAGALTLAPSSQSVYIFVVMFGFFSLMHTYLYCRVDVPICQPILRQFSTMDLLLNVRCLPPKMPSNQMKMICLISLMLQTIMVLQIAIPTKMLLVLSIHFPIRLIHFLV